MLLWLDLETTGLDPLTDHILEIAWTWTREETLTRLTPIRSHVVTPSVEAFDIMKADQFIQDMHGKSGLLDDLYKEGTLMRHDVEDLILQDIANHMDKDTQIKLAGFSVHFDHEFIANWLPRLNHRLHHRHYDVSTLKQFFEPLGIAHDVVNLKPHRARFDVEESLSVAQAYRGQVLEYLPTEESA